MSDLRSDLRVYVYDCPEDQCDAAGAYFAESGRGFGINWSNVAEPGPELEMDEPYTLSEAPYRALEDVVAELREAAPGVSFMAWSDPDSEGLGELIAFTPALGEYTGECDSSGDPVVTRSDVKEWARKGTPAADADRELGGPWFDHYDKHMRGARR
jgi:hypothetical protein